MAAIRLTDVDTEVEDQAPPNRLARLSVGSASEIAPKQGCLAGRRKHALVAALVITLTLGVGVLIAVYSTAGPSPIHVPERFQARVSVVHKGSDDPEYFGVVHKANDEDGEFLVSAQLTMPVAGSPHLATVITAIDDAVYTSFVNLTSGHVLIGPDCAGPHEVPPLEELREALADSSVVPASSVTTSSSSYSACVEQAADVTVVQWASQSYLACSPPGTSVYHVEGFSFTASLYDLTTDTADEPPFTAPLNADSQVPVCPSFSEALLELAASGDGRRLQATEETTQHATPLHMDWFLHDHLVSRGSQHRRLAAAHEGYANYNEAHAAMKRRLAHSRMLSGGDDGGDQECCQCRRRRLDGLPVDADDDEADYEDDDDDVPDPDSTTAKKVASFFSKFFGDPDRELPWGNRKNDKPRFCVCCLIPGIETPKGWKLPGFCTETVHVEVDVSKSWDDADEQQKLCDQITDLEADKRDGHGGPSRIKDVALFGLSSGNLILAGALASRRCQIDDSADFVWTAVEGLLNQVSDPYAYCQEPLVFVASIGFTIDANEKAALMQLARGSAKKGAACYLNKTMTPHKWLPTPGLLALVGNYPGLNDAVDVMVANATRVVSTINDLYPKNSTRVSVNVTVPYTPPLGLLTGAGFAEVDPATVVSEVLTEWLPCMVEQDPCSDDTDCTVDISNCDLPGKTSSLAVFRGEKVQSSPAANATLVLGEAFDKLKKKSVVLPTGLTGAGLSGYTKDPYWGALGWSRLSSRGSAFGKLAKLLQGKGDEAEDEDEDEEEQEGGSGGSTSRRLAKKRKRRRNRRRRVVAKMVGTAPRSAEGAAATALSYEENEVVMDQACNDC